MGAMPDTILAQERWAGITRIGVVGVGVDGLLGVLQMDVDGATIAAGATVGGATVGGATIA
jgi:hypothetical protein